MRTLRIAAAIAALMSATLCGCMTSKNVFGKDSNVVLARPDNVYRFAENTVISVMVQDTKTGEWKVYDKKVLIPIGYYVGSGIDD